MTRKDIARHLARAVWRYDPSDSDDDKPIDRTSAKARVARGRDPYLEQQRAEQ